MRILVIDVGGTTIKLFLEGQAEAIRYESGPDLSPSHLVACVVDATTTTGAEYDAVSLGYPGAVAARGPIKEPGNLGEGWLDYDFTGAFGKPTRIVNDAALQALGAYDGGRMLFLGLGTGLGSALVAQHVICPLELGELPLRGGALSEALGHDGRAARGHAAWMEDVRAASEMLIRAFAADYIVLGGGNADEVDPLPPHVRRGGNEDARTGGLLLWRDRFELFDAPPSQVWRVLASGRRGE